MTGEEVANEQDANAEREAPYVSEREKRFEVVATVLLAFAALATAWTGYQASLWDGVQSSNYTQASAQPRTQAAQLRTEANQYPGSPTSVCSRTTSMPPSTVTKNSLPSIATGSGPELAAAFEAWEALDPFGDPNAPPSPSPCPSTRSQPG